MHPQQVNSHPHFLEINVENKRQCVLNKKAVVWPPVYPRTMCCKQRNAGTI